MSTFLQLYQQIEEHLLQSNEKIGEYSSCIQGLKEENLELKHQLEEREKELQECKQKNNLLTINSPVKEDTTEIKKEINELVREIDHCIRYIKGE